ncbi:hypothetical protein RFI_29653 [Reticulomyxa filosa]|uniref:Uncharacterized protein n=1 Tax=Reticulomyxa filosa TaxID=46433 RepID=X6M1H4_RETFI|nr:hypothetical protein RFI_29653 [Reticulomyxa filosa]|eukprot:ETO07739.1 hypothetical protein RFI_29653 [Reticulomyxa filosa]
MNTAVSQLVIFHLFAYFVKYKYNQKQTVRKTSNTANSKFDFDKIIFKYVTFFYLFIARYLQLLKILKVQTNNVRFSPDGRTVASIATGGKIELLDIASGQPIQICSGHLQLVNVVEFSADGNTLVSCSQDKTVRLWDVKTGKELMKFSGHSKPVWDVHFSPDGKRIKELIGHSDGVRSVTFSPDNRFIVSGSFDETIQLWDVASGKRLKILKGHSATVTSVQYFPDGKAIVSSSDDNTIRLWDTIGNEIQELKGHSSGVRVLDISKDVEQIVCCLTSFSNMFDFLIIFPNKQNLEKKIKKVYFLTYLCSFNITYYKWYIFNSVHIISMIIECLFFYMIECPTNEQFYPLSQNKQYLNGY